MYKSIIATNANIDETNAKPNVNIPSMPQIRGITSIFFLRAKNPPSIGKIPRIIKPVEQVVNISLICSSVISG